MAQDTNTPPAKAPHTFYQWHALEAEEANRRRNEEGAPSDYYGLPQQNQWPKTPNIGPEGFPGRRQAGAQVTQSPNERCRHLGHKWKFNGPVDSGRLEEYICERCKMTRVSTVAGRATRSQAIEELAMRESAAGPLIIPADLLPPIPPWVCFYCGATFGDEDVLLDHEDDCAES